MGMVAQW